MHRLMMTALVGALALGYAGCDRDGGDVEPAPKPVDSAELRAEAEQVREQAGDLADQYAAEVAGEARQVEGEAEELAQEYLERAAEEARQARQEARTTADDYREAVAAQAERARAEAQDLGREIELYSTQLRQDARELRTGIEQGQDRFVARARQQLSAIEADLERLDRQARERAADVDTARLRDRLAEAGARVEAAAQAGEEEWRGVAHEAREAILETRRDFMRQLRQLEHGGDATGEP